MACGHTVVLAPPRQGDDLLRDDGPGTRAGHWLDHVRLVKTRFARSRSWKEFGPCSLGGNVAQARTAAKTTTLQPNSRAATEAAVKLPAVAPDAVPTGNLHPTTAQPATQDQVERCSSFSRGKRALP